MRLKNNRGCLLGGLYFLIHLIIEITSFYILSSYLDGALAWTLALVYDFLAFVPQGFLGYLWDDGLKIDFSVFGWILSLCALGLFALRAPALPVVLILAVGNGMIHVQGAETTLRSADGTMTPSAVFVSGGSFGVITGKVLALYRVPALWVLAVHLLMLVPIALSRRCAGALSEKVAAGFRFANRQLGPKLVIALAVFVVIVRAYMGYGIPTAWNKTLAQTVALYCSMGVGKALGGILIDTIGMKKTILLSTLGALPFLLFGNRVMAVSLIGILLFSMTMAVTLGLIVSVLQTHPGVAFGFTTVGLFLGSLPVFVFRIDAVWVNCVLVTALTLASSLLLNLICSKEKMKHETHEG